MSPPWMPFYVADYLGDTGHLSTTQHGAYLLLICHYWRTGGLPSDDTHLARIAKLSVKNWTEFVKPDLVTLFRADWRHKRIDAELARCETIRTKRVIAGQKGGQVTGASRAIAKAVSLSNRVRNQANAEQVLGKSEQVLGKRVATTITYRKKDSNPVAPPESPTPDQADLPLVAFEKKPPAVSISPELAMSKIVRMNRA